MKSNSTGRWQKLAMASARDAHKNNFHSRRGIWYFEDLDVLCLYNNHPYTAGPVFREKELMELRRRLREAGIRELAYGTWPKQGPDRGYSYAMIIDTHRGMEALLSRWQGEVTWAVLQQIGD
jgi:hypothetical protein